MRARIFAIVVTATAISVAGCGVNSALGFACTEQYPCPGSMVCDPTGHCVASGLGLACSTRAPCSGSLACDETGHCVGVCPAGKTSCSGFCTDTKTDVNNCGTCANVCPGQACDYYASMGLGFASADDCVMNVASVCAGADGGTAACIAAANPGDAGVCSLGMCTQTVFSSGTNCGGIGAMYDCPAPSAQYCVEGDCTVDDCSALGALFCFASECSYANVQCSCVQC